MESRASELLAQMEMNHQRELSEAQSVANQVHQAYQEVMNENLVLNQRLESQATALQDQRRVQDELVNNVRLLQSELTMLRHQGSSSTVVADNGTDMQNMHHQMVQMMQDLSKEVQMLKRDRQSDALRAQLNQGFIPPNPIAASPAWSGSACAGYPPLPVNIATPSRHSFPSNQVSPQSVSPSAAKPPASPGSSASSTTTIGGGGGGGNSPGGNSPSGFGFSMDNGGSPDHRSVGVGSGFHVLSEKDVYRSKDLSLVKVDQLPTSASAFRGWRNGFLTKTCSIDATGENVILRWLTEAFNSETGETLHHSGALPCLDAHLASLLSDARHLKSEIGMTYQSYMERCQMASQGPKGRYMIWLLAQQFRLDLQRGANLTEQSLLELDVESFTYNGLKSFVEKIEFVLNAIPVDHQPSERTKFTWLFGRVKRCKMIQRHIDKIKDSSSTSYRRTFDWLFGKIKSALWEMREDQNQDSIRHSLSPTIAKEKGISPKVLMPPRWMRRRMQERQRRCHYPKLSQRLSNPGKVMVKEKVQRGIQGPKGHLHRAKLNLHQKQRLRQKPKVSHPCHACFIQRVLAIVVQNVLLHT